MGRLANPKRVKGAQKRPPSPADEADAQAVDYAVQWMIDGKLSEWNHTRSLGSLNKDDLRALASQAIIGWVLARAEQEKAYREAEPCDQTSSVAFVG